MSEVPLYPRGDYFRDGETRGSGLYEREAFINTNMADMNAPPTEAVSPRERSWVRESRQCSDLEHQLSMFLEHHTTPACSMNLAGCQPLH